MTGSGTKLDEQMVVHSKLITNCHALLCSIKRSEDIYATDYGEHISSYWTDSYHGNMTCDTTTIHDQAPYEHLSMESQWYCVPPLVFEDWVPFLLGNLMAQFNQLQCKSSDSIVKFQHHPEQHHPGTCDEMKHNIWDFSTHVLFKPSHLIHRSDCVYPESAHQSLSHGSSLDIIEASKEYPPAPSMLYEQHMGSEGDVNIHPLDSSMSVTQQEHLDDRFKNSILSRPTPNHPPASSIHEQHLGSDGDVDNVPNNGETPDKTLQAYGVKHSKKVLLPSMTTDHGIQKTGQGIRKACHGNKFAPKPSLHDL